MSNVKGTDGKLINAPAPQTTDGRGKSRYAADGLTTDWFDRNPKPVPAPAPIQEVLATQEGTLAFEGTDGTKIEATTPLAPVEKVAPAIVVAPLKANVTKIVVEDGKPSIVPDVETSAKIDAIAEVSLEAPVSNPDVPQV